MPRRTHNRVDVYNGEELVARRAQVTEDPQKGTLRVREQQNGRGRWVDAVTYTGITDTDGPTRVNKQTVRTWTLDDGTTITGIIAGCGCGGGR